MAEGYATRNGIRICYEDSGPSGSAPLLLVMGVDASVLWWPPGLADALVAAGYRVIRFDNRDVGLSTYLDESSPPYGLDEMADDAAAVLDAVDLEGAHFVGVSLGGMIGQELALRSPARVRSLTLISTTPVLDERLSPPTDALLAFFDTPASEDPVQQAIDFARALAGTRFPFDEHYYRELVARDLARGTNPSSKHAAIPQSALSRDEHELVAVEAPTLVVHGAEDPLFPYDHAEVLAQAIPHATLVRWEGVGHELPPQLVPQLTQLLVDHVGPAG